MFGSGYLDAIRYGAQLISIAAGLWFAHPLERAISISLLGSDEEAEGSRQLLRVFLWFGLGFLIALPFLQIVGILDTWAGAILGRPALSGMDVTAWGIAPFWVMELITTAAWIGTFGLFLYVARPILRAKISRIGQMTLSDGQITLVLFAAAGQVWQSLNTIAFFVLRPPVTPLRASSPDRGSIGYLIGWILAVIVVVSLGLYYNSRQIEPAS